MTDVERLAYHRAVRTFAPQVRIAAVRKTLKKRRRFDAAVRALADGAPRCSLAPVVDGYMRCLSANCAEWRAGNPVPEPDGREHGYPRTALLELARELRQGLGGARTGQYRSGGRSLKMPRFCRSGHTDRPSAEWTCPYLQRFLQIDRLCAAPPVGAQPTPAAGTTCSTGRGATGSQNATTTW